MAQTINVPLQVSVTSLPEVLAVLRAARDVLDRLEHPEGLVNRLDQPCVAVLLRDEQRLRAAVDVLLPGPAVD